MTTPVRVPALEALRVNVIVGRARLGFSQDALAARAGVSRPTISRIERGSAAVSVDVVQRIADALSISVPELFIPARLEMPTDAELARRAAAADDEFIEAQALLSALDEAVAEAPRRYSRAGRPPMAH